MRTNKTRALIPSFFFLLAFTVLAVPAARAEDSYLYFQVNAFSWEGPKYFDAAKVGVWNTETGQHDSYLLIKGNATAEDSAEFIEDDGDRYHATGWAAIGDIYTADIVSFYVETYSIEDPTTPIWTYDPKSAKTYSQLVAGNHIYFPGSTDPQDTTVWVVPEPTSGLLLLLGSALLALRRKRG